ncbi:MAG: glutamine-hydrolyzing GMP synthase [Lachnospiraceae bacterium]|nr:glutamine-hydrolyzing GMP synthase [Lachnospiraceae bacterium]
MMEKILVLDFGGQYNQLIARRVREEHVYAEIRSYDRISPQEIQGGGWRGIIFTGGPMSVYEEASPHYDPQILKAGIPILGICYGAQLLAYLAGGTVSAAEGGSEYGKTELHAARHILFRDVPEESVCWMSHTDFISAPPAGYRVIASTPKCPCAALADDEKKLYGVQFHPEVTHTAYGKQILHNFLYRICLCRGDWDAADYAEQAIARYRASLAGKKVLLALSGGVDSSVAALLLHRAIGQDLICVFVDHGLLRKGEADLVEKTFRETFGVRLIRVDAQERFLRRLASITAPERKRKIIGEEFIRVFEEEARKIGHVHALAQGTIYTDVIESGKGASAVIKSHHNVGGLPERISFDEIVEPLRDLFKDEVRTVGTMLGLPRELVWRQPFPGPGLAVRIIGEVSARKVQILQAADAIFREEVDRLPQKQRPDQYFAVITDTRTVGVMGDARTYGYTVALRAVSTDDFMTADWSRIPFEVLERASSRITGEVAGISRVVYDISSKPPATVEWE